MARDHLGTDYSENMSDSTTYSCKTIAVDKCFHNDDCCSKICLHSTESSTATCVSEIENYSDFPVASPRGFSSIFNLKTKCHKSSDCNDLKVCVFVIDKSSGICMKVPKQTTPKPQTTLFSTQKPESCVIPGLYCKKDDDCCSKKCHKYLTTGITYCLSTIDDHSPASMMNIYDRATTSTQAPQRISNGLQCSKNTDCYSNHCGDYVGRNFQICLPEKNDLSTTAISVEIPKYCIKNRHFCTVDDDCCSKSCVFLIFNNRMRFCEEHA